METEEKRNSLGLFKSWSERLMKLSTQNLQQGSQTACVPSECDQLLPCLTTLLVFSVLLVCNFSFPFMFD